ncbi:MAG: hypothetical protein WCK53_14480 [Methanomicrobiales archaeon]
MKTTSVIIIALIMLITLNGVVMADQGVPAVPGAGGITSSTVISSEGIVMESQSFAWSINGGNELASRDTDDPTSTMLDPNETQYSTTYDASTVAQAGKTTYVKTLAIDTGNKLVTQSNIKADTAVTFVATGEGGNILGSENIMIDGASMRTASQNRMICPFGSDSIVFPAYTNIVTAGSRYDLNVGSVVTSASDRFVDTDARAPVVLNYAINVKPYTIQGQGTSPAMGSASAYVNIHIQEARGSHQAEDLTDTESSSASGIISSFSKTIAYQSGKSLLP